MPDKEWEGHKALCDYWVRLLFGGRNLTYLWSTEREWLNNDRGERSISRPLSQSLLPCYLLVLTTPLVKKLKINTVPLKSRTGGNDNRALGPIDKCALWPIEQCTHTRHRMKKNMKRWSTHLQSKAVTSDPVRNNIVPKEITTMKTNGTCNSHQQLNMEIINHWQCQ